MVLVGILMGIIGILVVLSARSITTFFHELGHAIPALLFTDDRVDVYVGSYGDISKSWQLDIGRLRFYLTYKIWGWDLGMCVSKGAEYYFQQMLIVLAGPLMSLGIAAFLLFALISYDSPALWKGLFLVFFFSTIWDFFVNIIPGKNPIELHDGTSTYNDGALLIRLWQEKDMPDVYFEGMKAQAAQDYIGASKCFEETITLIGPKKVVQEKLLSSLMASGENQKALDFFVEQHGDRKLSVAQFLLLGDLYMKVQQYENALKAYSAYLYIVFRDEITICKKGMALLYLGEFNLAIAEFDIAIRINEEEALAYAYRGRAYLALRLWRKAEEDIDKSLALKPDLPEAHLFLGMYQEEMKEYTLALESYTRAKELEVDYHGIDFLIASVEQSIGRN
ncbi:MAG: M50 family metallopeptidase [Saprospiraceae bacterium]|nr:M50 family metallopeptidase [Saprospiraceae bacterium]